MLQEGSGLEESRARATLSHNLRTTEVGGNADCRAFRHWSQPDDPTSAELPQPAPAEPYTTAAAAVDQPRHSRRHAVAGRIKFALRQLTAREPATGSGLGSDAGISPVFVDPDQARPAFGSGFAAPHLVTL